jgi:hypothetical protein
MPKNNNVMGIYPTRQVESGANETRRHRESWAYDTFNEGDSSRYFARIHHFAIKSLTSHIKAWSRQQTYETALGNATLKLILRGPNHSRRDIATL